MLCVISLSKVFAGNWLLKYPGCVAISILELYAGVSIKMEIKTILRKNGADN